MLKSFCILSFFLFVYACAAQPLRTRSVIQKDPVIEKKVQELLNTMTLEEKVAQMIQAEIKHIKPSDLNKFPLGSILNGGGSFPNNNKHAKIIDWVNLADSFYEASIKTGKRIPIIWGTDAVHGHNNVLGATIYPHNIGLGATQNPKLIEKIAAATTKEVLVTGIDWIFAPTVAVVRNDRWGRTYEGYSEDPKIVRSYATSMIQGMQGKNSRIFSDNNLIATAKHFVGDGGTTDGVDQGNNTLSEKELIRIHTQGYISAINAGVQTVMASFNSWNGKKIHGHKYLLTEVLKNKMSFDGFVIGDWNGHGQVQGCRNDSCPQAIMAGVDMIMAPQDWKQLYFNTIGQVKSGEITLERINDAVTRILRVKMRAGIFKNGLPSKRKYAGKPGIIGSKAHRDLGRQAVRESLVLLKNKNSLLPIAPNTKLLLAGSGANNIGKQAGGWSVTWQGTGNTNKDFPGGTSIFQALERTMLSGSLTLSEDGSYTDKPEVALVVFGEDPYAEGQGDIENLNYSERFPNDLKLLKKFKADGIKVISLFITGRPLWINQELNNSDAFVVAWLPGTEADGISDVLLTKKDGSINYDFKGKLSFSWPNYAGQFELNKGDSSYKPLFPYGYGLTYSDIDRLGDNLSERAYQAGGIGGTSKVEIFSGRPIKPYKAYMADKGNKKKAVAAGIGFSKNKVVESIAIDKDIQEDARQLSFNGKESGSLFLESTEIKDFTSYFGKKAALSFDLRKDSKASDLNIGINKTKLSLAKKFKALSMSTWTTVTIPIKCFVDKGLDITKIKRSFEIETSKKIKLSLANVKFLRSASQAYSCDEL